MPYLDESGLTSVWAKIKATFSPLSHTHTISSLSGTVSISKGGTGATNAAAARTNLGAAASSHNHSASGDVFMEADDSTTGDTSDQFWLEGDSVEDALTAVTAKMRTVTASGGSGYTLPVATSSVLGGIKVGSNLSISSTGVLSAINTDTKVYSGATTSTFYLTGSTSSGTTTGTLVKDATLKYNGSTDTLYAKNLVVSGVLANALIKDEIVAQGTCDFWAYRMYASGVAECWGATGETSVSISSAWGSLYESGGHVNGFPGNTSPSNPGGSTALAFNVTIAGTAYDKLFTSLTQCDATFWSSSGSCWAECPIGGDNLTTPTVLLLRPNSATVTGRYAYHAWGKWK